MIDRSLFVLVLGGLMTFISIVGLTVLFGFTAFILAASGCVGAMVAVDAIRDLDDR